MIYFICQNDYQVMRAVAYAATVKQLLHIFNLSDKKYVPQETVSISYPSKQALYNTSVVLHSNPTKDTVDFIRVLYDLNTEIHTFGYANLLYHLGRDNITLHEQGDTSYILNSQYLPGELIPDTVQEFITEYPVKDPRNLLWDMNKSINILNVRKKIQQVLGYTSDYDEEDLSNTVLFVHNEPDSKYTQQEKLELYEEIKDLIQSFKDKGFTVWVKLHHKRKTDIDFDGIADKVIDNIPLEALDRLDDFKHIVSVRNSGLENLKKENCYNGLTKDAILKCKKNWKYVYSRGIQKIKKNLKLN